MLLTRSRLLVLLACAGTLAFAGLLTGCGSGSNAGYIQPPSPLASAYAVKTTNYYTRYSEGAGTQPFPASWQFTNTYYPLPVSTRVLATTAPIIDLATEGDNAVRCWHAADPRICILGGAGTAAARIHLLLEDDITLYGQVSNVIGLTSVEPDNPPAFRVEIATRYNANSDLTLPPHYEMLTADELKKTIVHELGHAFGLGHSPDPRDVMYFQASQTAQGTSYATFLTYGDAMTLWTTLNARQINWQQFPAVSAAPAAAPSATARNLSPRGPVVDIYRMPPTR